jgi:hypothetical protein
MSVSAGFFFALTMSRDRGSHTYEYSGETTEWEDILVKKGVVTREQVFVAKGLDPRDVSKALSCVERLRFASGKL